MQHIPVLMNEVIESLQLKPNANVIDCTLGDGGHAVEILKKIAPKGKLLGIDVDSESLLRAKQNLYDFESRTIFVRDNFVNLKNIVEQNNFKPQAILMDLGWSSPQFAERGRGFSFLKNEALDMRYDPTANTPTAKDLLNNLSEKELEKIFREYGEEKNSRQLAQLIAESRKEKAINTTEDLVALVEKVNKAKSKIHPATRVFQALRIAVNDELGVLKKVFPEALEILPVGGRLAIITFHSLEDRIVKHYFKGQNNKILKIINKKPIICSEEEYKRNPRARSAKLRVIEKI